MNDRQPMTKGYCLQTQKDDKGIVCIEQSTHQRISKIYISLILRLGSNPALQSGDKGALRINPEQPPAFRPESRRVDFRSLRLGRSK